MQGEIGADGQGQVRIFAPEHLCMSSIKVGDIGVCTTKACAMRLFNQEKSTSSMHDL